MSAWVRRVEVHDTPYGLWIVVPDNQVPSSIAINAVAAPIVLAFTDHDWRIEYMNADADLLGVEVCGASRISPSWTGPPICCGRVLTSCCPSRCRSSRCDSSHPHPRG